MNFNLNIHRVRNIHVGAVRTSKVNDTCSASREIIIETDDGTFELSLFSAYVDEDSEEQLLEVKV